VTVVEGTGRANGAEYSSCNVVRIARASEQRAKHILHCWGIRVRLTDNRDFNSLQIFHLPSWSLNPFGL